MIRQVLWNRWRINETGTLEQMEDETDPLPTIVGG
jgi:hypothetical protein